MLIATPIITFIEWKKEWTKHTDEGMILSSGHSLPHALPCSSNKGQATVIRVNLLCPNRSNKKKNKNIAVNKQIKRFDVDGLIPLQQEKKGKFN